MSRHPRPPDPSKAKPRSSSHAPAPTRHKARPEDTSWERSADWYDRVIGAQGSDLYRSVVIPGAMKLLDPKPNEKILDLGCGQGVLCRTLAAAGSRVTGVDLSRALIRKARDYPSDQPIRYLERDAADLRDLGPFDAAASILALQNMEHLPEVARSAHAEIKPGGRMLWVLNHPILRIPRQTSWGWDEEKKIQYRRLDAYGSALRIPIVMHPGKPESETTFSFHKSLEELMQAGLGAGWLLGGLQEWYSHKQSEPGPRARAEDRARQEFPLFLALLWRKI